MRRSLSGLLIVGILGSVAFGAPAPIDSKKNSFANPADFFPNRKHLPLPGKIIAVLVTDAQPLLSTEGRSGPADQLCVGYNGGSYRWVYVPVKEKAMIQNLSVALPEGKSKVYPLLSMASPTTVKPWGISTPYTLVEVEVNDGFGSPAGDAFTATNMKPLDGTTDFPIKVADVIAELRKDYERHLSEKSRDLDAAMEDSAKKALKEGKATGPIDRNTLMFVTWMAESQRLQVRFRTRITNGEYKYANGINIDLPRPLPPVGPAQGGIAPPPRLPQGLKYGTEFGIEYGVAYEVTKGGKIDSTKILEVSTFSRVLPMPQIGPRPRPIPLPVLPKS